MRDSQDSKAGNLDEMPDSRERENKCFEMCVVAREMVQALSALAALRRMEFNSQHPHGSSQLPVTTAQGI
jgi:hypothetical protein